jgi:hypothetical protein
MRKTARSCKQAYTGSLRSERKEVSRRGRDSRPIDRTFEVYILFYLLYYFNIYFFLFALFKIKYNYI